MADDSLPRTPSLADPPPRRRHPLRRLLLGGVLFVVLVPALIIAATWIHAKLQRLAIERALSMNIESCEKLDDRLWLYATVNYDRSKLKPPFSWLAPEQLWLDPCGKPTIAQISFVRPDNRENVIFRGESCGPVFRYTGISSCLPVEFSRQCSFLIELDPFAGQTPTPAENWQMQGTVSLWTSSPNAAEQRWYMQQIKLHSDPFPIQVVRRWWLGPNPPPYPMPLQIRLLSANRVPMPNSSIDRKE